MKDFQKAIVVVFSVVFIFNGFSQETYWSREFADAIIKRYPTSINQLTDKGWEYSNSIVLIGIEKLYCETGDEEYIDYIKSYVDSYIDNNGNISFDPTANNLDHLHPGWLCITLYEELGDEKYKLAADNIRAEFDNQPRNDSGGFWHKQRYPNQMWADGIYMAEPFLIRYGAVFDDLEYAANEATNQAILLFNHAYDSTNHLLYHGWDETKEASWADSVTGRSPEVWSRALGWYMMALVDILDYLPEDHANYDRMIEILQALAVGIEETQDTATGLWYQVVNKGDSTGNWHETSGSSMFVYSLKKAIDNGYISDDYKAVVEKGWEGVQSKITLDNYDRPVINDFVGGMGIKDDYETYVSQEPVSTPPSSHPHGYCGVLLAASQMEFPIPKQFTLSTSVDGAGTITKTPDDDKYDTATVVVVGAMPFDGWEFESWSGDVSGSENPLTIQMDSAITLQASFVKIETDIKQVKRSGAITVYPTFVTDYLEISFNERLSSGWKLKIIDTQGKTLDSQLYKVVANSKGKIILNISSEVETGIYYLQIQTNGNSCIKRFVVK